MSNYTTFACEIRGLWETAARLLPGGLDRLPGVTGSPGRIPIIRFA